MEKLNIANPNAPTTIESDIVINVGLFKSICYESSSILNKVFKEKLVLPKFIEFCDDITDIYEKVIIESNLL